MNALTLFQFDEANIRVLTSPDGEPIFVAKDIALALGYANPQKAVRDHCKGSRAIGVNDSFTPLDHQTLVISEPDVLRLIIKSSLPSAVRFEKLVFEEILPSIRKTGAYASPQRQPMSRMDLILMLKETEEERLALKAANDALAVSVEQAKPAVRFHAQVAEAINSQTVEEAAKSLPRCGEKRLFAWLREKKLLMSSNLPYQDYIDRGYFKVIKKTRTHHLTGESLTYPQTLITGRGFIYIEDRWNAAASEKRA